jgi:hypothetical protein
MSANTRHPSFKQPKKDIYLWKYLDFANYVSLLSTQRLYFSRLDTLEDPWEGIKDTDENADELKKNYIDLIQGKGDISKAGNQEKVDLIVGLNMLSIPGKFFVSCWHANENESMAMWKIYANMNNSISIKAKYSSLVAAFDEDKYLGLVDYRKNGTRNAILENDFQVVMSKRIEYQFEREVRIVKKATDRFEKKKKRLEEEIDLREIVAEVVVSPRAESWFFNIVRETTRKFDFDFVIRKSALSGKD